MSLFSDIMDASDVLMLDDAALLSRSYNSVSTATIDYNGRQSSVVIRLNLAAANDLGAEKPFWIVPYITPKGIVLQTFQRYREKALYIQVKQKEDRAIGYYGTARQLKNLLERAGFPFPCRISLEWKQSERAWVGSRENAEEGENFKRSVG